jgi:hypothetical protein
VFEMGQRDVRNPEPCPPDQKGGDLGINNIGKGSRNFFKQPVTRF